LAFLAPLLLGVPWLVGARSLGVPRPFDTLQGLLLVLLLGTAVVTDLLFHRIFNWTTYTAVAWVFFLQGVVLLAPQREVPLPDLRGVFGKEPGEPALPEQLVGLPSLRASVIGMLIGFGIMLLLYVLFRGGAGDLKLITALGALLGEGHIFPVIAYTYIVAGVYAACYFVWQVGPVGLLAAALEPLRLRPGFLGPAPELGPLLKRKMPMAVYIALGAVAALAWPTW
jgi:Flp pilus assembly protein protease CpaA